MLGIGLMAGFVFLYEPHWTPSGLLKSMGTSLWHGRAEDWAKQRALYIDDLAVSWNGQCRVVYWPFLEVESDTPIK